MALHNLRYMYCDVTAYNKILTLAVNSTKSVCVFHMDVVSLGCSMCLCAFLLRNCYDGVYVEHGGDLGMCAGVVCHGAPSSDKLHREATAKKRKDNSLFWCLQFCASGD